MSCLRKQILKNIFFYMHWYFEGFLDYALGPDNHARFGITVDLLRL